MRQRPPFARERETSLRIFSRDGIANQVQVIGKIVVEQNVNLEIQSRSILSNQIEYLPVQRNRLLRVALLPQHIGELEVHFGKRDATLETARLTEQSFGFAQMLLG